MPATDNQFAAILTYRNQPDFPPQALTSNWSVDPTGEVEDVGVASDLHTEMLLDTKPSIADILRAMAGDWTYNDAGQVAAIGQLRFSDGKTNEERAYKKVEGEVVPYMRLMEAGAILGTDTKASGTRGAGEAPSRVSVSNARLTAMLLGPDAIPRTYIPAVRRRRRGKSYSANESRAMLSAAIANTPVMPEVTRCQPGIAAGTAKSSDCFVGMKVAATGKSGAVGWVDIFAAGRDHGQWMACVDRLSDEDKVVLDASLSAQNYSDVGMAAGQSDEYARRKGGKRRLVAANDNLAAELRKFAA